MSTQNFKFSTCFPPVHPCSFYMQNAYEFLNETFRSEKRVKCFFVNSTQTLLFTQIYIYDNNNKNICMLIYKNTFKKVYAFFIKLLATAKQLITRNSIYCLKNQAIFQSEHRDRFDSFPPAVCFHSLFKQALQTKISSLK